MDTTSEIKKDNIHAVLAYSYGVYFGAFIIGIILYFFFPSGEPSQIEGIVGMFLLGIGTLLVFWAQSTSRISRHKRHNTTNSLGEEFQAGPYKFTRSPTHLGIAVMLVSFSFLMNSVVLLVVALLSYIITRNNFIEKEEKILLKKYGERYEAYMKRVKW